MPKLPSWMMRAWSSLGPYRPMAGGKLLLDKEYADGAWDYLADLPELGRFSVLAGYCQSLSVKPRILEIGCGEGLLPERLCHARVASYTGVDISERAITRAAEKALPDASFITADAAGFEPSGTYDLILFTECLEYFDDPLAVVQRYEGSLTKDGHFLVSMFVGTDTNRTARIWKMLAQRYAAVDETRVTNAHRLSWIIRVLRP